MKSFSIAYLLFVTGVIVAFATVPPLMLPPFEPARGSRAVFDEAGIRILVAIAQGLAICLFFHLITKGLGVSFGWRIVLNALVPFSIFAAFYTLFLPGLLSSRFLGVIVFIDAVKFSLCSVMAEVTMRDLGQRFAWLGDLNAENG